MTVSSTSGRQRKLNDVDEPYTMGVVIGQQLSARICPVVSGAGLDVAIKQHKNNTFIVMMKPCKRYLVPYTIRHI